MSNGFTICADLRAWEIAEDVLTSLENAGIDYITVGERTADDEWESDYYRVYLGKFTNDEIYKLCEEFAEMWDCDINKIAFIVNGN